MPTVTGSAAITGTGVASLTFYSSWADRPYMIINGTDITDHGRKTKFSVFDSAIRDATTVQGYRSAFYPRYSKKASITSDWTLLPDTSSDTADGREGRLFLKELASSKKIILLYIKNLTDNTYSQYNVIITSYSEKLIIRRNASGGVLYNIGLGMQEL